MKLPFKLLLALLLLFSGSNIHAQTDEKNTVDSLLDEVRSPKLTNTGKAILYETLAFTYDFNKKYDTASIYFLKASALYDQAGDKKSVWRMAEMKKQMDLGIQDDSNKRLVFMAIGVEVVVFLIVISMLIGKSNKQKKSNLALLDEKKRSEELLLNILPEKVATEIREKGITVAQQFNNVSVIFTDFVSFTKVAERFSPAQLVGEMHACFKAFDEVLEKCNIEKIKTVGDAYLAVSGLPTPNRNHAVDAVTFALLMRNFMVHRKFQMGDATFEMRIGIHTGSVIAGIVGVKKFAYDIWGDTVNTAARMEQNSEPGKITISESTYQLVKDKFVCEYRGEIEAKNKGKLKMYFVVGPKEPGSEEERVRPDANRRAF
jgi:class 3 adenylate cyclase